MDILNIFANVALSSKAVSEVRSALQGISEWFDQYISEEESIPGEVCNHASSLYSCSFSVTNCRMDSSKEPELNKIMVLLLARCWDYKLKTEDVLELTQVQLLFFRSFVLSHKMFLLEWTGKPQDRSLYCGWSARRW